LSTVVRTCCKNKGTTLPAILATRKGVPAL
jgi:hypothetical protein